jgi:hypothetical protein
MQHIDKGVLLGSFASEAFAVCPKCDGPALVGCKSRHAARSFPSYQESVASSVRFSGTAKSLCGSGPPRVSGGSVVRTAGSKWLEARCVSKSFGTEVRKWVGVTCPECEPSKKIQIRWTVDRLGQPHDPAFGLPLWLQLPCCGETLWAYNESHLQALRDYVAADLREDDCHHWSMFARLPKWVSAKKNRTEVLKSLNHLEERLPLSVNNPQPNQ